MAVLGAESPDLRESLGPWIHFRARRPFQAIRPTVDHPLDIPSINPKDMKQFAHFVKQAANGNVVVITYHGVPDYEHDFAEQIPRHSRK